MPIPDQQLKVWSAHPNPSRSVSAHTTIKSALLADGRFNSNTMEVYIQGSYKNNVNTRQDSDVDIVAELTSVCEFDTSSMDLWSQQQFWAAIGRSEYGYQQFRGDVLSSLTNRFRQSVSPSFLVRRRSKSTEIGRV